MAARVQRMAAAHALDCQPAALQRAKTGNRLHRVFRTTGCKPATWPQQWADETFVAAQNGNEGAVDHVVIIGHLVVRVVAAPGWVGYKDAPFPELGSCKEAFFVAAKKPAKKAVKVAKKPAKPVAKKAVAKKVAVNKPVVKKAVAKKAATKPTAKKAVAKQAPVAKKAAVAKKAVPAKKAVAPKAAAKPAPKPAAKAPVKAAPAKKASAKPAIPPKSVPKPAAKPAAAKATPAKTAPPAVGRAQAPAAKAADSPAPAPVAKPTPIKVPVTKTSKSSARSVAAPASMAPTSPRPVGKVAVAVVSRPSATPAARTKFKVVPFKTDETSGRPLLPNGYKPAADEEYMSVLQLEYFRQRLLDWRADLVEESKQTIENLKDEVRDVGDEAERATRETENSLELRTRDRYRKLIGKIDSTLKRLEGGDYGYCVDTGEEIGLDRLEARLTAERTIDAQERWEHLQKQQGD